MRAHDPRQSCDTYCTIVFGRLFLRHPFRKIVSFLTCPLMNRQAEVQHRRCVRHVRTPLLRELRLRRTKYYSQILLAPPQVNVLTARRVPILPVTTVLYSRSGLSESYFAVTCIHRGRTSERPVGVARVHMRQVREAPGSRLQVATRPACLRLVLAIGQLELICCLRCAVGMRRQGWFELHDALKSCAPHRALVGPCEGVAAINLEITTIEMSSV
jgi:hypothetical protein